MTHPDSNPLERASQPPSSLPALAQWIERSALRDMLRAASSAEPATIEPWAMQRGAAQGFGAAAIPSPAVNRVFLGGEGIPVQAADARTVLRRARAETGQLGLVHVHAADCTPELADVLAREGLRPFRRAWVKLARERGPVAVCPTRLSIATPGADQAGALADLLIRTHGLVPSAGHLLRPLVDRPGWHAYVAREAGRLVAAGLLFVQGEVGYLCLAGTDAAFRGRGAQSALLEKRLRVAFALGCRWVFAETGVAVPGEPSPSYDNMQKLGLSPLGVRENYAEPGTRWS